MKLVLTLPLLCIPSSVLGASFHVPEAAVKEGRYLEVIDVVDSKIIDDVAKPIHKLKDGAEVYMLINSPGGSVDAGTTVLDAMKVAKARGVTFKCIAGVMAASMAFIIINECDERYALPGTRFMFHPITTGGRRRTREAVVADTAVIEYENKIMKGLQKNLGMEWKEFYYNYMAETTWTGLVLHSHAKHFITIVTDVTGLPNLFCTSRPNLSRGLKGSPFPFPFPMPQQAADILQAYEIKQKLLGESEYVNKEL